MDIRSLSHSLGAEVSGINVSTLNQTEFEFLLEQFHKNIVLVVKNQDLSPASQTEFACRFGEIQYHISPEYVMKNQPEVMILSNETQNGKVSELRNTC